MKSTAFTSRPGAAGSETGSSGSRTAGRASRIVKTRRAAATCSSRYWAAAGSGCTASKAAMPTRQMTARLTPSMTPSRTIGMASTSRPQTAAWVTKVMAAEPRASMQAARSRSADTVADSASIRRRCACPRPKARRSAIPWTPSTIAAPRSARVVASRSPSGLPRWRTTRGTAMAPAAKAAAKGAARRGSKAPRKRAVPAATVTATSGAARTRM